MSGFGDYLSDNSQVIGQVGGGIIGSLLGPGGTVAGAGIGGQVAGLLGGGTASDGSSAEFRDFIRATGAGAWEETLRASGSDLVGKTKADFLPSFYEWLVTSGKSIGWWAANGNPMSGVAYVPGLTETSFRQLGIDYAASAANYAAGNRAMSNGRWAGWVYLNGDKGGNKAGTVAGVLGGMPWEPGAVKSWTLLNWAVWLAIAYVLYRWVLAPLFRPSRRKKRRSTL